MCGICGQYNRAGTNAALVEHMATRLHHRGPDGYAVHQHSTLAFGAARLAIIDLSAPAGPLYNENRAVGIAFNGEIYNYRALRAQLLADGHVFQTGTDTEVIVHGYEQWGIDVLQRLRGKFAFALWDGHKQRLLLARDRLGQTPLYYMQTADGLLFASEIKALLAYSGHTPRVNTDALPLYLTLGYVPPPATMFAGINKLAPGQLLLVDADGLHTETYWQPQMAADPALTWDDAVQQVRAALFEAVELRMISDVPVGAFLSGGVDSTAVTAIMGQLTGHPVETFTVGFDFAGDSYGDQKFNVDAHYATRAAGYLGTNHHTITVKQDASLAWLLPRLVYALDEPIAQRAVVQTVHVSALARLHGVPVLLSGDAGDELFGGYNHYRADLLLQRYLRAPALLRRSLLNPLLERLPDRFDSLRKLAQKSRVTDPALRYLEWMRVIDVDRAALLLGGQPVTASVSTALRPFLDTPQTPNFADRIAYTSLLLWVAEDSNMRVDKMAMAMSVEPRSPFEDHHLAELALRIPLAYKLRGGDFKTVLKVAVADLVPQDILHRPKWGFMPPASDWLRTVLRPLVDTYLSREYVSGVGIFDPDVVHDIVQAHLERRRYDLSAVWSLLVFHLWHALYIDQSLVLEAALRPEDLYRGDKIAYTDMP